MRTISGQNLVSNPNTSRYPNGGVINEEGETKGTPVVDEVYGDIIENLYKVLRITNVTPTENPDFEGGTHQLVEALTKLINVNNDIKHVLSLSSSNWILPVSIDLFPNGYFLFAKASEVYNTDSEYTVSGQGSRTLDFVSVNGFQANDDLILFFEGNIVRAISLTSMMSENDEEAVISSLALPYGEPLSYNDSSVLFYFLNGTLFDQNPNSYLIENTIRLSENDFDISVVDCFVLKDTVLVLTIKGTEYSFYRFNLNQFDEVFPVPLSGFNLGVSEDNQMYVYVDGDNVYLSNSGNNSENDFDFVKMSYDGQELSFNSSFSLSSSFSNTTNYVIINDKMYTLVNTSVNCNDLSSGDRTFFKTTPGNNGVLFSFNNNSYFSSNSVGSLWQL